MKAHFELVVLLCLMLTLGSACCRMAKAQDSAYATETSQSGGIERLGVLNYTESDSERHARRDLLKSLATFEATETLDAAMARRYITVSHEPSTWPQQPLEFAPSFSGMIRIELHSFDDPSMKPLETTQVEPKPHFWERSPVDDLHRLDSVLWAW